MTGPRRDAATWLLALVAAEVAVTIVTSAASGLPWDRLTDLLVVSNTLIGTSLALAGWPIAHHRPGNLVGWSLLAGGCTYAVTGTGVAVLAWASANGWDGWPWRVFATVVNAVGWSWAFALLVPLALVVFPDGRLPGRRWRWLVAALAANGALLTALGVLDPYGGLPGELGLPGYPAQPWFDALRWLERASGVGLAVTYLGALAALGTRYRRGPEQVRRQLLWLLLAVIVMLAAFTAEAVLQTDALLAGILPVVLIPLAIAIAILRHQLLDIQLVVSRSVLYLLLTGAVVAAYLGLVAVLERVVRPELSLDPSLLAVVLVALGLNPVRLWLQRLVHRAFYGARHDPVGVIAAVGARLGEVGAGSVGGAGISGALQALCDVLRLPAASVLVGGTQVAAHGTLPALRHAVALRSGDESIGELVVGLRGGEHRLAAADERVLSLLAAPLTVAVEAGRLAEELRLSRERVISGREEERRRLRRDLHDGLGPVLTGVVLHADAALHLIDVDRDRAAAMLAALRDQTMGAIEEIRRIAYDLRPPVLDGMGLVGAVREYAAVVSRRDGEAALEVSVEAPASLAELPAAVEVAAYRIVTEALTNVVRHSSASLAVVRLELGAAELRVHVDDNGVNADGGWHPGVGITSIRERTAELGGECELRYDRTGGRTRVRLPLTPAGRPATSVRAGADA